MDTKRVFIKAKQVLLKQKAVLAILAMPAILPRQLRLPRRPHRNRRTVPTRCPPT